MKRFVVGLVAGSMMGLSLIGGGTSAPTSTRDLHDFPPDAYISSDSTPYPIFSDTVGDLNGDGIDDLVLASTSSAGASASSPNAGAVFVTFGSEGLDGSLQTSASDLVIHGGLPAQRFGTRALVTDVTNDQVDDLIVSSSDRVDIFFGGPSLSGVVDLATQTSNVSIRGVGASSLAVGDLDGDTRADLVLGGGAALVFFDVPTLGSMVQLGSDNPDVTIYGADASDLGVLSAVDDFDGDGIDDAVISNHTDELHIFKGRSAWPAVINLASEAADSLVFQPHMVFGSLFAADLIGDSRADLVVGGGVPSLGHGKFYVFDGASLMGTFGVAESFSARVVNNPTNYTAFASDFAAADLDEDSHLELLVAQKVYPCDCFGFGGGGGAVHVFDLTNQGFNQNYDELESDLLVIGGNDADNMVRVGTGDFNGDGLLDIVLFTFAFSFLGVPRVSILLSPIQGAPPPIWRVSIDCDISLVGVQQACTVPPGTTDLSVGVVLTNHSDGDARLGTFDLTVEQDATVMNAGFKSGDMDGNPDFAADSTEIGDWSCGSPGPDNDLLDPPGGDSQRSFISCFNPIGTGPVIPRGGSHLLGLVHYDVVDGGDTNLSLRDIAISNHEFVELHSCEPVVTTMGECSGATITVESTIDSDGDGLTDTRESLIGTNPLDSDSDDDGYADNPVGRHARFNLDPHEDNCPLVANPEQLNTDGNFVEGVGPTDSTWANSDTTGDPCDPDDDNDGLFDSMEAPAALMCAGTSNIEQRDTDADRFLDGVECFLTTDPVSAASKLLLTACGAAGDPDGDKIQSRIEVCFYGTDPNVADTDGDAALDGAKDGCEIASLNGDRIVNAIDLGMVASGFPGGTAGYTANADINKDGAINAIDLGIQAQFIVPAGQCP